MPSRRVIIVDDHPLFRDALRQSLHDSLDGLDIAEAGSLEELAALLNGGYAANLVLLDLAMPGVKGFSGLMYLRATFPAIPVVIISATEHAAVIRRCFDFGASGFIPKSLPVQTMRKAIKHVLGGEVWAPPELELAEAEDRETGELVARLSKLTPQQVRVLMMLSEGLLNKQIAYKLGVSEATVKAHVSAILQKLGVDSRTQAVIAVNKVEGADWPKAAQ